MKPMGAISITPSTSIVFQLGRREAVGTGHHRVPQIGASLSFHGARAGKPICFAGLNGGTRQD